MLETPLSFEAISDAYSLAALEREWTDLYAGTRRRYLSQTFEWCSTALTSLAGQSGWHLHCLVARRDGKLVLVWPFVVHDRGLFRVAKQLGSYNGWHVMLRADGDDAVRLVTLAWQQARASLPADLIEFRRVLPETPLAAALAEDTRASSADVERRSEVRWDAYASWDAYLASRSRSFLQGLRRKRRRLEEWGQLSFELIDDSAEYARIFDWIWQNKVDWIDRTGRQNYRVGRQEYRKFLSAAGSRRSSAGSVAIFVLRLDGAPIAAELATIDQRFDSVMGAYETGWGRYSPGEILREFTLQWAFERRLRYDLGPGDERHKISWRTHGTEMVTYLYAASILGMSWLWLRMGRAWLTSMLKADLWMRIPYDDRQMIKRLLVASWLPHVRRAAQHLRDGLHSTPSG
jgi:CelD/BcsL family acetyltransferase involved in cellulose biosynthesis